MSFKLAKAALGSLLLSSQVLMAEPALQQAWQLDALDQPESVVADAQGEWLYISNINGAPLELNGKGYISRVDREGQRFTRHWLAGFNAPKGMAISKGKLYVADMQVLHEIDLTSGKVSERYHAPHAHMLNDVTAAPDGSIYVSDMLAGGIYRLADQQLALWLEPEKMPHPNGLLWEDGQLIVASWGLDIQSDFTTKTPGTLYQIDPSSQQLKPIATGYQLGNLDGVVSYQKALYISDWISGALYRLEDNERRTALQTAPGLADIGRYGSMLYAPMMLDNKVVAWMLP